MSEKLTPREQLHEEIKTEIRGFAERMCSLIDSMERLTKAHEDNEKLLAEQVDYLSAELKEAEAVTH